MKSARSAWPICIACLAFLGLPQTSVRAQDKNENETSARRQLEDRLLEAELLEVSSGDLEKAMVVYRELADSESTPEPVRARALLYLARCHRKLGQVDRAKELLDRLVEKHAEEREVLRQARVFLRELRGEKVNPEFDWLAELGKNPEIQSRVFDLAMDMVDLNSEAGQRARRQLLALGTITVPVLEKMVTTSRDTWHRHHLALLLVQLGKVEYWKVLLDPASPVPTFAPNNTSDGILGTGLSGYFIGTGLSTYFSSIPELSEAERARLLDVLRQIPRDDATEPYRQLILLRAGEVRDFAKAIPSLEVLLLSGWPGFDINRLFAQRLEEDPAAPKAVADRLLDPECGTQDQYYRLLEKHAPTVLGVAHHKLMLERVADALLKRWSDSPNGKLEYEALSHPLIAKLEEARAFDALKDFVPGVLAPNLVDYFWKTYIEAERPGEAPAGWAAILRQARPVSLTYREAGGRPSFHVQSGAQILHLVAEVHDGFIGELEGFLQRLQDEEPGYRGYGKRYVWPWLTGPWKPSPRYVEAMEDVLDVEHPFSRLVALEALSLAVPLSDRTVERVEAIAGNSTDDVIREVALYTLVCHFAARPEAGTRVARALMAEVLRRLEAGPDATRSTALPDAGFGSVFPPRAPPGPPRQTSASSGTGYSSELKWVVRWAEAAAGDVALELYPHVVDLTGAPEGRRFHAWFRECCIQGEDEAQANALLLAKAVDFQDTARRVDALEYFRVRGGPQEDLLRFLSLIATDREIETEERLDAIRIGNEESLEWFDWPQFLKSPDPLLDELLDYVMPPPSTGGSSTRFSYRLMSFVRTQDAAARDAFWAAALASPHEAVRAFAYRDYPGERSDAAAVFGRGLEDPKPGVRLQAKARIVHATRDNMLPLLLTLLQDDERSWRIQAIEALQRLALQESIEPLVKLLDDSDFEIRGKALEALKAVRTTLEEKREWKALLEGMKEKKAPGGTR